MDNSGTARVELVSPNHAAREEAEDGNDEAMEEEQVPEPESSLAKITAQNDQGHAMATWLAESVMQRKASTDRFANRSFFPHFFTFFHKEERRAIREIINSISVETFLYITDSADHAWLCQ